MLKELTIQAKLIIGFGLLTAILAASTLVSVVQMRELAQISQRVEELSRPTVQATTQLVTAIQSSLADLRGFMLTNNDKFAQARKGSWQEIDSAKNKLQDLATSWQDASNINKLQTVFNLLEEFRKAQAAVESATRRNKPNEALSILLQEAAPRAEKISTILAGTRNDSGLRDGGMLANQRVALANDSRYAMDIQVNLERLQWILLFIGIVLATVIAWIIIRSVVKEANAAAISKSVLDSVTSSVMVANTDNIITYMNRSTKEMFKRAEEDVKTELNNFCSDNIIGKSIDYFHSSPEYRRAISGELTTSYELSLTIGNRIFDLTINPVTNDKGERLGTAIEWQDVTESKAQEEKSIRVQTSLDVVSSNVMVADENDDIIYMNAATRKMLKAAEADIRKDLPKFDVDEVVGSNIALFHKNPEHQRNLLRKLQAPHKASIKVGGRSFDLVASPIIGENNQRLGTVVEWQDITQELIIEEEVRNVVDAASVGDFSKQLSIAGKEGFMLNLSKGINQLVSVAHKGLSEVVNVLSKLEDGDLTNEMTGDYEGMFNEIKQATNGTIYKLRDMVNKIQHAAGSVNNAANEISSGSVDLSQRTEEQASTLEETAASMEELTTAVRQNSENAKQASSLASNAEDIATKGGNVVDQAVEAMAKIEDSSQKVSDIISVIDEIAFQTNLLALNAAVEAARAGEAGKGFAVVASEVRSLASRSASASKEIKTLINVSREEVESGAKLVNAAGETLQEIVSSVKEVTGLVMDITKASAEQAAGIEEINSAITQMDETTQQNAALVEENTAAAHSMVEQSSELERLVSFFKLDSEHGKDNISSLLSCDKIQPIAAKYQNKSTNNNGKVEPILSPRKPTAKAVGDYESGWEEF